jgi:anaphase-promoting complex subunit 5
MLLTGTASTHLIRIRFLDAWRAGDYPTSFDNLHRFFDYTMQNRDRLFYQYALLNLAVLQADFGCYQEAVAAMQETVSTARENKDMGCLNFSLSWLYHFGKAHPTVMNSRDNTNILGIEREGLTFLRVKAKESGMWSLWGSSLLSEAKMGLSAGESVSSAFENVLRSSQLNVSKNMMSNVGVQMLLQSSLWSRLGVTYLAWSYCEGFLHSYSRLAPFDDILKISCRSAFLLCQNGQYTEARAKLEQLDPNSLRSLKASQYWLTFRGILQLQQDLHRGNLDGADQLLSQLLQCRGGDPDITFEVDILHIDLMTQRGDYNNALCRIEEMAASFKREGEDVFFRVKLLNMKALLLNKCDRPQKGFSVAVRAATIAWRAHLLPSLWEAMGIIASVLTSLYEFSAASRVLTSIIPRALECEDAALSAELWSIQVDAYMGQAGQAIPQSLQRKGMLTMAMEGIERCFAEWDKLGNKRRMRECVAKKGMILGVMGEVDAIADVKGVYQDLMKVA